MEIAGKTMPYHESAYQNMVSNRKTKIFETKTFCILPDYGPVTVGHALIVTKKHVTSFACLSTEELTELDAIISSLRSFVSSEYAMKLEFFEHGSDISLVHSMASVSHAHLHVIPTTIDLDINAMPYHWHRVTWKELCENEHYKSEGYLMFIDSSGIKSVTDFSQPIPQYFRRVYSKNNNYDWDWKKERSQIIVDKTISFYDSFKNIIGDKIDKQFLNKL